MAQSVVAEQVNKVAAVVNGQVITMFDLQRNAIPELARERLSPNNPSQKKQVDAVLRKALDIMIMDILINQEAQRLKVTVSDSDVDAEITHMYKSRGMNRQQFEQTLAREKTSLSEIRDNVRKGMLRQKVMGMEVGRRVVVSREEIKRYYEEHKSTMYNRKGLHMAVIVYHPQAPAAEIARKLKNGEMSWMEASRKYSLLPNRDQGGDGGEIQWDKLNAEWRGRMTNMQPGDVTDLFKYNDKFMAQVRVFRPGDKQEPLRIMTLEEATPMIDGILRNPKAQDRYEDYAKQLRAKAVIDVRI